MKIFINTKTANSSNDPKTNNILMFQDVEDYKETPEYIEFVYVGKSTGTKNRAVFFNKNIAGYIVTESDEIR